MYLFKIDKMFLWLDFNDSTFSIDIKIVDSVVKRKLISTDNFGQIMYIIILNLNETGV